MASMAGFIPGLAEMLGVKASTLDERQKALVRAGLLTTKPGRGPGSGVKATPESVAMLLISMLAPGGLAQTHLEAKAIAKLESEGEACRLTGKKTFKASLSAILADEGLARYVGAIRADRAGTRFGAKISWPSRYESDHPDSYFGFAVWHRAEPMRIATHLYLPFDKIARSLRESK